MHCALCASINNNMHINNYIIHYTLYDGGRGWTRDGRGIKRTEAGREKVTTLDVMHHDTPMVNTQLPATKVYFCPCYGQKGASTRGFVLQLPLKHRIVSIGG